jgi:hypothetical protein
MSTPSLYLTPCNDCSGVPSPSGTDTVAYVSNLIHSGYHNYSCSGCTVCGVTPTVMSYQPFSVAQSFFVRNRNEKIRLTSLSCGGFTPDCADPSRGDVCTENCDGPRPNRIRTFAAIGGSQSPFKGAVSQNQYLDKVKDTQRTMVRGRQLSQSALLRANRPRTFVNTSGVNKNTAGQLNVMNPYPPNLLNNQNQGVDKGCCTGNTTDMSGNYLNGVIADPILAARDYVNCPTCPT